MSGVAFIEGIEECLHVRGGLYRGYRGVSSCQGWPL